MKNVQFWTLSALSQNLISKFFSNWCFVLPMNRWSACGDHFDFPSGLRKKKIVRNQFTMCFEPFPAEKKNFPPFEISCWTLKFQLVFPYIMGAVCSMCSVLLECFKIGLRYKHFQVGSHILQFHWL